METWEGWLIGVGAVAVVVLVLPYVVQIMVDGAGGAGSSGGGPFGVLQEIFHPGAHESSIVVAQEAEREQAAADGEDEDPAPHEQKETPWGA